MNINTDCSAVLEYEHGSMGSANENGILEKTDKGYQFVSGSGGGQYDVRVEGMGLVMDGYNWRCEMGKD